MNSNGVTKITQVLHSQRRRRRWKKIVSIMAALVILCTNCALILPAITMTTHCGMEEHQHTEACYTCEDPTFWLCQQEEQAMEIHQHDKTCYDETGQLVCGTADFMLHTHDDICYDETGNLRCTLPEITGYHKTTLFLESENGEVSTPSYLQYDLFAADGTEDSESMIPDGYIVEDSQQSDIYTEPHSHSEDCYDEDGKLICEQLKVTQHQHTWDCLQGTLICGLEEHQHNQDCYTSADATETATDGCSLAEHQHEEACYDDEGNLSCGMEEHSHTEACSMQQALDQVAAQMEAATATLTTTVADATIQVTFPADALPEDVTLQAQEIAQEDERYADYYAQTLEAVQEAMQAGDVELKVPVVRFFDITFLQDDIKVEPTAPVTVTITYEDEIGMDDNDFGVAVHFAADGTEVLSAETDGDDDSVQSFTFTQDSFSVTGTAIVRAASATTEATSVSADYDDTPSSSTAQNHWQVVAQDYIGSGTKYTYSADNTVRIKKTVEALGEENQFRIHVTVEPEATDFQSFLETTTFVVVHNNSAKLGSSLNTNSGTSPLYTEEEYQMQTNQEDYATLIIKVNFAGETYTAVRYFDTTKVQAVNNGGVGLWTGDANGNGAVDDAETICISKKGQLSLNNSSGYDNTVCDLTSTDLSQYITITRKVSIPSKVIDPMGNGITYRGNATVSAGSIVEPTDKNQTLTWTLPDTAYTDTGNRVSATASDGKTHIYYKNAYTLTYDITLTDYSSCGLDGSSGNPIEANVASTNGTTSLLYRVDTQQEGKTDNTVTGATQMCSFELPKVRGLKYALTLKKIDADDATALSGAIFTLYTDQACQTVVTTATSDSNGILTFRNLLPGTYYVQETTPPTGYQTVDTEDKVKAYVLCYTTNSTDLQGQGAGKDALYDDTENAITNQSISKTVIFQKVNASDQAPLAGAAFTLYQVDADAQQTKLMNAGFITSGSDGIFSPSNFRLASGTYQLVETQAPEGYHKLVEPIEITVDSNGVHTTDSAVCSITSATQDNKTVYTVLVTNTTGTALPQTGGSGTAFYRLLGLALLAAAWLWWHERGHVYTSNK